MLRYNEFIRESLEFILESDVVYSSKFRQIISSIKHPISGLILDVENKDFPVQSNFFDIDTDKNDMVSFIPDRKAKEILGDIKELVRFDGSDGGWLKHTESNDKLFARLGYTPDGEVYKPNSREVGEVVAKITSDVSGETYAWVKFEGGQGVYNVTRLVDHNEKNKEVWTKNRQEVRVGRAIRALLVSAGKKDLVNKDIEEFVNLYKTAIDKINDRFSSFDVVKGDDISYWYDRTNYHQISGTLGNSCMSSVRKSFFDIYVLNPENVSLVILKHKDYESKIVGRAILWKLDNGITFLDRIYTINDSDVTLFRDYAKENGWYSKYINSSTSNGNSIAPNGEMEKLELRVTLKKGSYDKYPYLDTLKYLYEDAKLLSNDDDETGCGYHIELEDTQGGHSDSECEVCGGSGNINCDECDGVGRVDCSNCDGDGTVVCDTCGGDGEIKCDTCHGVGTVEDEDGNDIECSDCGGSGKIECDDCGGRGDVTCDECGGRGHVTCGECDGEGDVPCPECG